MVIRMFLLVMLLDMAGGRLPAQQSKEDVLTVPGAAAAGKKPEAPQPQSFRLINPEFSPTGRWIVVRQTLDERNVILAVLDTERNRKVAVLTSTKLKYQFTGDHHLLLAAQDSAELWDLKAGTCKVFAKVKDYSVPSLNEPFALLGNDATVRWYTSSGIFLNELAGVSKIFNVRQRSSFYSRNKGGVSELWTFKGIAPLKVYETVNKIERISGLTDRTDMVTTEFDGVSQQHQLVLINESGHSQSLLTVPAQQGGVYPVWPLAQGRLMIMQSENKKHAEGAAPVSLYADTNDLETKLQGFTRINRSWIWDGKRAVRVALDSSAVTIPTGHSRYILNYHPTELQDYLTFGPKQRIKVLDTETGTQHDIGIKMPEYNRSRDGRYIVFRNEDGKWQVSNVHNPSEEPFFFKEEGNYPLSMPLFTQDTAMIIFESADGMWQYNIAMQKLSRIPLTAGHTAEIINRTGSSREWGLQHDQAYADLTQPVLIKLRNELNGRTSIISWDAKEGKVLLKPTLHSIQYFVQHGKKTAWTEEFYNSAPKLMYRERGEKEAVLVDNRDPTASTVKRDIIYFRGSAGERLQGVLYYPTDYREGKKYPMVVNVYQVQNPTGSLYIRPGERNDRGIDIRLLQDNGYFVFLPDTVVNSKIGPGRSALHCVNAALDALASHGGIDFKRMGLTGHSFGGYETNFIATQSDRFAAYISGAGISDIFYDYFSIVWHYTKPSYWKLETNQMDLRTDFASNKNLYTTNNPIWYADKVRAPILLWTGKKDFNVHWEQTLNFYLGLRRYEKPVAALLYPQSRHTLNAAEAMDLRPKVLEWWDYWLKGKKEAEWIREVEM